MSHLHIHILASPERVEWVRPEFGWRSLPLKTPVMLSFVQQSETQNGPRLRFSLWASGQGLTTVSGGGEIHFFRQIHATSQVLGRGMQIRRKKSKGKRR